jgi:uncharacterized protein (TIGR03435 family)
MFRSLIPAVASLAMASLSLALPLPGDAAPPLIFTGVTNGPADTPRSLEELKGKVVVLEFWATWCGPCIKAIPHLNELQTQFPNRDEVVFLAITDEPPETTQPLVDNREFLSPIAHDDSGKTFRAYGVRAIPRTIVISPEGIVVGVLRPDSLTRERLQGYIDGQMDRRRTFESAEQEEVQDRFERLSKNASGTIAGADPLSAVPEILPEFQIIVRKNPHGSGGGIYTQRGLTLTKVSPRALLANLSGLSPGQIVFPDEMPERDEHYDLIVRWPRGVPAESLRIAAATLAAQGLGYNAEFGEFNTKVYRLIRTPSSPVKLASVEEDGGYRSSLTEFESIEGARVASLIKVLESTLRRPIIDETDLEGLFEFPPITFEAGAIDSINHAISTNYGLELVEDIRTMKVLRLAP